jgi:hypothetical protein
MVSLHKFRLIIYYIKEEFYINPLFEKDRLNVQFR